MGYLASFVALGMLVEATVATDNNFKSEMQVMAKKKTTKKAAKKVTKKAARVAKKKPAKKKLTDREKAAEAARAQLHDGLYAVVMKALSLADAQKIIEEEVKEARRLMLEEYYREHPKDLAEDSGCDIATSDKDDVDNQAADFVGGMNDEEIDAGLMEYI